MFLYFVITLPIFMIAVIALWRSMFALEDIARSLRRIEKHIDSDRKWFQE
jgi:hypothetical protein